MKFQDRFGYKLITVQWIWTVWKFSLTAKRKMQRGELYQENKRGAFGGGEKKTLHAKAHMEYGRTWGFTFNHILNSNQLHAYHRTEGSI